MLGMEPQTKKRQGMCRKGVGHPYIIIVARVYNPIHPFFYATLQVATTCAPSPTRRHHHFLPLLHATRSRKSRSSQHTFEATMDRLRVGGMVGHQRREGIDELNDTTVDPLARACVQLEPRVYLSRGFLMAPTLPHGWLVTKQDPTIDSIVDEQVALDLTRRMMFPMTPTCRCGSSPAM